MSLKFDEDGKRIKQKEGLTVVEEFNQKLNSDTQKICNYLNMKNIPTIRVKTGPHGSGLYNGNTKEVFVCLGTGNYDNEIRRVLIHELLHAQGHQHGSIFGYRFQSRDDQYSPMLLAKIFKEEDIDVVNQNKRMADHPAWIGLDKGVKN